MNVFLFSYAPGSGLMGCADVIVLLGHGCCYSNTNCWVQVTKVSISCTILRGWQTIGLGATQLEICSFIFVGQILHLWLEGGWWGVSDHDRFVKFCTWLGKYWQRINGCLRMWMCVFDSKELIHLHWFKNTNIRLCNTVLPYTWSTYADMNWAFAI